MKKEKIIRKAKDKILWEDFVAKNNIKKKISSDIVTKSSSTKHKATLSTDILVSHSHKKLGTVVNAMHFSKMNSPQIDIDIEKNKLKRIKSGRIDIEGTMDLHGFSLKEAKSRLQIFVGESFQRNKRLLLIITGKGRNSKPNIHGKKQTIKSEINKWLLEDFYRDKVQYISRALDKHGGDGAYYFFLVTSKNVFS
jgi:DNA-nicking Smr family endonuclease